VNSALAKWRRWGVGVVWDATEPDDAPVQATATALPAPQVNFTVVHVQAGALVNFGGIDPRLIPAVPQQRAAISTGGLVDDNDNGGAIGVTDDEWLRQQQSNQGGKRS
jgi:hypothetical protein